MRTSHPYILFLLSTILAVHFFVILPANNTYQGYIEAEPTRLSSCKLIEPAGPRNEFRVIQVFKKNISNESNSTNSITPDECRISLPKISGRSLGFYYRFQGVTKETTKLRITYTEENGEKVRLTIPNSTSFDSSTKLNTEWESAIMRTPITAEDNPHPSSLLFELIGNSDGAFLEIRSRIEVLDSPIPALSTFDYDFSAQEVSSIALKVISALLVISILTTASNSTWIFACALCIFIFHFYREPFFYFDEWHVLQRFSEIGLSGVIYTHNEHFLPFYFLWEYLSTIVFGEHYWLYLCLGLILATVHMHALSQLIYAITKNEKTSRLFPLLFSISAVHGETMQWAFEQSMILCGIVGLHGIRFSLLYIRDGNTKPLLYSSACFLAAPLLFGTGFLYPILAGALLILLSPQCILILGSFNAYLKRILHWGAINAVFVLVAILLYYLNKDSSAGHGVSTSSMMSNWGDIFNYTVVGMGMGSILRPLGLYPSLSMSTIYDSCRAIGSEQCVNILKILLLSGLSAEVVISLISLGMITAIILIVLWKDKYQLRVALWGLFFIGIFFVLIALGRAQYGELQSLALRYQFHALAGLTFTLAALFQKAKFTKPSSFWSFILLVWIIEQAVLLQGFTYLRTRGVIHRNYAEAAHSWFYKEMSTSKSKLDYPLHQTSITPGKGLPEIAKTYHWLKE